MWSFMHVHIHFPTIHCAFELHACILSFCAHGHWFFLYKHTPFAKSPVQVDSVFFYLWWDLNFEPCTSPWLSNFLCFLHLLHLSRQWNICCCSFWKTICLHQHNPTIICTKCFPGICGVSKVVEQAKIRLLLVAASWPGPRKQKDQEEVSST